jgi:hypothetical protein
MPELLISGEEWLGPGLSGTKLFFTQNGQG